jgi:glycogen(starch) synthase
MHFADLIIAVSNFTKQKIVEHYGIAPDKIRVVHNAVEFGSVGSDSNGSDTNVNRFNAGISKADGEKIILFLGRITLQKGPDYFLYAAKKVLELDPRVKFIIAGSGDMMPFIVEKAAELGISKKVLFTGFLSGAAVDRVYRMADLYVMPSVSEPFGITPLEAMRNGVPVLISKQSGVSEVITNCLKTDFWDINDMANKMIAALRYNSLHNELRDSGNYEVKKFSWDSSAERCLAVYNEALRRNSG